MIHIGDLSNKVFYLYFLFYHLLSIVYVVFFLLANLLLTLLEVITLYHQDWLFGRVFCELAYLKVGSKINIAEEKFEFHKCRLSRATKKLLFWSMLGLKN